MLHASYYAQNYAGILRQGLYMYIAGTPDLENQQLTDWEWWSREHLNGLECSKARMVLEMK